MKRSKRAELAAETVDIVERGSYRSTSGRLVDIAASVRDCLETTRYCPPEDLRRIRRRLLGRPIGQGATIFEVVDESTLSGVARASSLKGGRVAVLNFASAKNPGGGFLNGSHAQEESLARSSALYASQMRAWEFYERHRASSSLLYSDAMILSPECPIFRDDDGNLLEEPLTATFITSAAPNAGAAAARRSEETRSIPTTLHRRSEYVLALAASQECRLLVLGAWGCGVFRNAPEEVADSFAVHLRSGLWAGRFDRVIFSILDGSHGRPTLAAFRLAFGLEE